MSYDYEMTTVRHSYSDNPKFATIEAKSNAHFAERTADGWQLITAASAYQGIDTMHYWWKRPQASSAPMQQ